MTFGATSRATGVARLDCSARDSLPPRRRHSCGAQADWDAFCRSTLAVVDVRGPEIAPGAALMIGACAATGRSVLARYSAGWQTFADGREPNWRNLMVQYAVQGHFAGIHGFIALTDAL